MAVAPGVLAGANPYRHMSEKRIMSFLLFRWGMVMWVSAMLEINT